MITTKYRYVDHQGLLIRMNRRSYKNYLRALLFDLSVDPRMYGKVIGTVVRFEQSNSEDVSLHLQVELRDEV